MISVDIRVTNYIELLNDVASENIKYSVWPTMYGDDWVEKVKDISDSLSKLYNKRHDNSELNISYSFFAAQILKKMLLYYIEKNHKDIDDKKLKRLISFIITIDDRIESELQQSFSESIPGIEAWDRNSIKKRSDGIE